MSMLRGDDEQFQDNLKTRMKFVLGCGIAVVAVFVVLLLTLYANKKPVRKVVKDNEQVAEAHEVETTTESTLNQLSASNKRTSDQMNFWHMYDEDKQESTVLPSAKADNTQDDRIKEELPPEEPAAEETTSDNKVTVSGDELDLLNSDQAKERKTISGNIFDVNELIDGTPRFVAIDPTIKKNERFEEGFVRDGVWLDYALNGRKTSLRGIDVSMYQKKIDWKKVSEAGVDFAMLRMGSRGYGSGRVVIDEEFTNNMNGCSSNGIRTGVYFYSMANTPIEAVEEANYVVAAVKGHPIDFPIVFVTEAVADDSYRTENLTMTELSTIAKAFCDTITLYGYTPMIGATKKQFAEHMELSLVKDYDWWLFDSDPISVFPYRYNMWQYTHKGEIDGIEGNVNLDISFVDYTVR
ncbi:Lyzozyme M1 (1,4-beta-N-acetylmuramidase), GH25 family [Lachnospiraceae bacterium]|nr:Lyzozyme M1 (1,4-beta-N-acetylmuramidase), GH25 family [Lachnospiraceae bacterium]